MTLTGDEGTYFQGGIRVKYERPSFSLLLQVCTQVIVNIGLHNAIYLLLKK